MPPPIVVSFGRWWKEVSDADVVVVGSFVPEGILVGEWVLSTAQGLRVFYDIDTPVTLRKLASGDGEYISNDLIKAYDLYLSFTGGPILNQLEQNWARTARVFCTAVLIPTCIIPRGALIAGIWAILGPTAPTGNRPSFP